MHKINVGKDQTGASQSRCIYMVIQHRKCVQCYYSQINANLNKEVYTPYLTGKNHINFELGKADYQLIEYFWKAI